MNTYLMKKTVFNGISFGYWCFKGFLINLSKAMELYWAGWFSLNVHGLQHLIAHYEEHGYTEGVLFTILLLNLVIFVLLNKNIIFKDSIRLFKAFV